MKLTIQGSAKEIAALVLAVQERREEEITPTIDLADLLCTTTVADLPALSASVITAKNISTSSDYKMSQLRNPGK